MAIQRQDAIFQRREEFDQLATIRMWSGRTDDGSRSDLDFRPLPSVWEAVQSEDGNCLGRECPQSQGVLLLSGAAAGAQCQPAGRQPRPVRHRPGTAGRQGFAMLPKYDVAIIDEAHTLEAVAGQHLGLQLSSLGRRFHAGTAVQRAVAARAFSRFTSLTMRSSKAQRTRDAADDFFDRIADWYRAPARRASTAGSGSRSAGPRSSAEELRRLATAIDEGAQTDREARGAHRADRGRGAMPVAGGRDLGLAPPDGPSTRLLGRARKQDPAPDPARLGARWTWARACAACCSTEVPTCVLTSATLCVGSPPQVRLHPVADRADRRRDPRPGQPVRLRPAGDRPLAEQPARPVRSARLRSSTEAIRAIAHYLEQTQGKAFVLFTSYKMLEAAARALTPWLARRNIALFAQSDGMPRSKMVDAFKADVNSVIFGADSFWQGVDVPGEALSNVIITRLPFSVPSHPLLEARLEDIRRRGGNPFVEYQVPEAVIKLKQGFGRLIRTKSDRGIVVILDPRVLTKPYGRTFLNSLPQCPRIVETPAFDDTSL